MNQKIREALEAARNFINGDCVSSALDRVDAALAALPDVEREREALEAACGAVRYLRSMCAGFVHCGNADAPREGLLITNDWSFLDPLQRGQYADAALEMRRRVHATGDATLSPAEPAAPSGSEPDWKAVASLMANNLQAAFIGAGRTDAKERAAEALADAIKLCEPDGEPAAPSGERKGVQWGDHDLVPGERTGEDRCTRCGHYFYWLKPGTTPPSCKPTPPPEAATQAVRYAFQSDGERDRHAIAGSIAFAALGLPDTSAPVEVQHAVAARDAELAKVRDYADKYHAALKGLEEAGWPCRLEELPAEYDKMGRELAKVREENQKLRKLVKNYSTEDCDLVAELRAKLKDAERAASASDAMLLKSFSAEETEKARADDLQKKLEEAKEFARQYRISADELTTAAQKANARANAAEKHIKELGAALRAWRDLLRGGSLAEAEAAGLTMGLARQTFATLARCDGENLIKDVHTQHCCPKHGCKYGDKDCTVTAGKAPLTSPCEECEEERT